LGRRASRPGRADRAGEIARRITLVSSGLLLATGLLAAPGSPAGAASRQPSGGVVTFAEQAGAPPNYLFPMYDGAESGNANITDVQPLMWLPLYWFGSNSDPGVSVDAKLSMADPPKFSDGNKTVTMTLKNYDWSTGTPVTARDLVFWMNIILNNKTNYSDYIPGGWMDHVASYSAASPTSFVLKLSVAYNQTYLIDDALSILTPIPQQTWDKTSPTSPVGNYDETPSGAKQVYKFLNKQSESLSTWDTNPLWQVVDGPWRIKPNTGFQVTGQITFVPNKAFSGPDKPKASEFEELPFTSTSAEFNALRSGGVDYGYVPPTDLAQVGSLKAQGYTIKPWYAWGISFVTINYSNPKYGPIVRQLYVRQAMEMLIDQPEYIKTILGGYATSTDGPVPSFPKSAYLSSAADKNPYPYDPSKARHLLEAHGWSVAPGGTATCKRPGTGPTDCGSGISSHAPLEVPLLYASGVPSIHEEVQAMQTAFDSVGLRLLLKSAPSTTVLNASFDCQGKTAAKCAANSPTMSFYGSPSYTYVPTYYPIGTLWGCSAPTNAGNYCNSQAQHYISGIPTAKTAHAARTFLSMDLLLGKQLPALWMPNAPEQISAISPKLGGVETQDSSAYIYPATWYVKS
jgi:peptide/nickel transport system substrate-binding protein